MDPSEARSLEVAAAQLLGGVLDAVYSGDLTADGPAAKALVQHLEGALIALRVLDQQRAVHGVDLLS